MNQITKISLLKQDCLLACMVSDDTTVLLTLETEDKLVISCVKLAQRSWTLCHCTLTAAAAAAQSRDEWNIIHRMGNHLGSGEQERLKDVLSAYQTKNWTETDPRERRKVLNKVSISWLFSCICRTFCCVCHRVWSYACVCEERATFRFYSVTTNGRFGRWSQWWEEE